MTDSQKGRVLIAEDNVDTGLMLQQLLRLEGIEATLAADGVEALECLSRTSPDVLLTDIDMPRKNGIELIEEIREQEARQGDAPALPIIAMSAGTGDMLSRARRAGAVLSLDKLDLFRLLDGVKELLRARLPVRQLRLT
jgi:CheY-like chemotaxis protein